MAGHMGQYLLIAPRQELLVLRMGVAQKPQPARGRVFELFLELLESEPPPS